MLAPAQVKASPAKVVPKPTKPKGLKRKPAVSSHPSFNEMVICAITALKERNGSSRQAISKYIKANNKVAEGCDTYIKLSLKRLVAKKMLVQVKGTGASGSFKVASEAKKIAKPAAKKPAAKKPAAKKPAAKKSTLKKKTLKKVGTPKKSAKKTTVKKTAKPKSVTKKTTKPAAKGTPKKTVTKKPTKPITSKKQVTKKKVTAKATKTKKPAKK